MTSNIIRPSEFDISKLTYGEVKKYETSNGKMVSVGYNNAPFVIQTCECYAPFGVGCYQNDDGKPPSYALNLSFRNMEERKTLKALYDMYEQIDKQNIEMGMANAMTWCNQKKAPKSVDVIEALYTPQIIMAKDDKYPSTFKFKLPIKNGKLGCDVYDKDQNLLDLLSMDLTQTKGAKCKAIIQCTGIWLAGSKFGMSWKCVQLQICQQDNFNSFSFMNIPDDNITGEDIDDPKEVKKSNKKKVMMGDEGEERDEDDDDEEEDDDDNSDGDSDDDIPQNVPLIGKSKNR